MKRTYLLSSVAALVALLFIIFRSSFDGSEQEVLDQHVASEVNAGSAVVESSEIPKHTCGDQCGIHGKSVVNTDSFLAKNTKRTELNDVFKRFSQREKVYVDKAAFRVFDETQKGDDVSIELGGIEFKGEVVAASVSPHASKYAVSLEGDVGRLVVSVDGNDKLRVYLGYEDESRMLLIQEPVMSDSHRLPVDVVSASQLFCLPDGAVYPIPDRGNVSTTLTAPQSKLSPMSSNVGSAPPALESAPNAGFCIYIDFDGENVIDSPDWGTVTAAPHPKANDQEWVTVVWERVVEDFAPFDINITTDRAVFDATDVDKRLQVIVTPTQDFLNYDEVIGGIAGIGSFRENSPIVWCFNLTEYDCAFTISHEVGHSMGLFHDGRTLPGGLNDEYYGGHGTGVTSWAPIMGASWDDEDASFLEHVTQWSLDEYEFANNSQDDMSIIGGVSNGFGFNVDLVGDNVIPASGDAPFGFFTPLPNQQVAASGVIERNGDIDIFQFSTDPGIIDLTVSPLDVESTSNEFGSDRAGANLAVGLILYDASGVIVATSDPADSAASLSANITRDVAGGVYYLAISGESRGANPFVGFSDYGSVGQYTVSGSVAAPPITVIGGDKFTQNIFNGDMTPSLIDGTDFGFNYPSGGAKTYTFNLQNTSTLGVTSISAAFPAGSPFSVVSISPFIPGQQTGFMTVAFDPNTTGLFEDTLTITYTGALLTPSTYTIAVAGTSTPGPLADNYGALGAYTFLQDYDLNSLKNIWFSDDKGLARQSDPADWYSFNVSEDDVFLIVEMSHDSAQGALELNLYNNSASELVGVKTVTNGVQTITYIIPDYAIGQYSRFYAQVTSTSTVITNNSYDLRWNTLSSNVSGDDFYEQNDNQSEAFNLTGLGTKLSELVGLGVQNDDDWYRIDVPADPRIRFIYVDCAFVNEEGNIDIQLYGPTSFGEGVLQLSTGDDDRETISQFDTVSTSDYATTFTPSGNTVIVGVLPGTYYVRVYGDNAGNEYDLTFEAREDDLYEVVDISNEIENDRYGDAYDLGTITDSLLLSDIAGIGMNAAYAPGANSANFTNLNDDDWFSFQIDPSNAEQVLVDFVDIGGGRLGFEIARPNGLVILSSRDRIRDFEFDFETGNIRGTGVRLIIENPNESSYLIRVFALDPVDYLTAYDFEVTLSNQLVILDDVEEDAYEENERFFEGYDIASFPGIPLSAIEGFATLTGPDWYRITIPENAQNLLIEANFVSGSGALEVLLADELGRVGLTSVSSANKESISWSAPTPGVYYIGINGDYIGTTYNLIWDYERTEDNYEQNDERLDLSVLSDLSAFENIWLNKVAGKGVQADDDWFKITVPADAAQLEVRTDFDPFEGDIDLEVYSDAGYIVARSVSVFQEESVVVSGIAPGVYYIRLYFSDAGNEYDLWWSAPNSVELNSRVEDNYEENDSRGASFALGNRDQRNLSAIDGVATQTDEDWYSFEIETGNFGLRFDLSFIHAEGDIDLEIYDSFGALIALSRSVTDGESINYNAPLSPGTYYVRIYGSNTSSNYDFYWVDLNKDIYEDNDSREGSYNLTGNSGIPLSSLGVPTQGDDDWYRVAVGQDNSFLSVELSYVHANGNIDLELYDSTGALVPNSTSATVGGNESFFLQLSAGDYFIKVFGADAYNDYDLEWNVFEDDIYEENDFDTAAENISTLAGTVLSATQFDDDWFSVEIVDPNATFFVNLAFIHADGNIDLEIYDALGALAPVDSATSTDDNEAISFQPSAAGTYYIRVFGDDRNIAYTLVWNSILDDGFEENDTFVQSTDTSDPSLTLIVAQALDAVQLDDDWFQLDVPAGDVRLDILLEFLHVDGDLGFEIYDSGEVLLNTVNSSTDNESITFGPDPVGASYFIKVFGPNTGTDYTLSWTSSTRDSYEGEEGGEGNNLIGDAFDLTDTESRFLQDVGGLGTLYDEDWYAITHTDTDLLVEAVFTHANGDIDIEVFNPGGLRIGGSTSDTDDVERIELFNIPTGTYYIRVFGDTSSGNPYDLIWNSFDEDNLETSVEFDLLLENDTHSEATDIMERELILESDLTQLDDDWYIIAVAGSDDTLTVRVEFEHLFGNIDIELYDETEVFVPNTDSLSETDEEGLTEISLTFSGLSPGNYYLRVFGRNVANSYNLRWNSFSEDPYDNGGGNNIKDDAYDLTSNENKTLTDLLGQGVQLNEDWYKVERSAVGSLFMFVQLSYTAEHGNLDLRVYDESDALMAESIQASGSPKTVSFSDLVEPEMGSETYYIQVTGDNFGIPYELIWRSVPDDIFEENDSIANAYDWDSTRGLSLNAVNNPTGPGAIQADPDYYQVEVPAGQLRVQAIATFIDNQGNLSLEIFNEAGQPLGSVDSTDDDESLTVIVSEFPGVYYILVDGPDEGTGYDLVWNYDNEDNYEINDSSLEAFKLNDLGGNPAVPQPGINDLFEDDNGPATQTNEDYYSVVIPASQLTLTVDLDFDHDLGDINLEILDDAPVPNVLGTASSVDDGESLTVTVNQNADLNADPPDWNRYFIRVYGDDAGNRYNLTWETSPDDVYEINNFIEDAYDLTGQENVWLSDVLGLGAQLNDDWFIIVVSDTSSSLTVEATFTHDDSDTDTVNDGNINLDLYQIVDADPAEVDDPTEDQRRPVLVDRADSTTDDETVIFTDGGSLQPGLYYLRVYFQNAGNRYDLRWDDGVVDVAGDATYTDDIGQFVFTNPNPAAAPANFTSNPDGDIFPNWAEYALALDANSRDQLQISQLIEEIGGEEYYTISFLRSKEAAARNFQYVVEESTNLNFDGTEAVYVRTENVSADIERVVYRCNRPRSEVPACFFRVTVNEPVSGY